MRLLLGPNFQECAPIRAALPPQHPCPRGNGAQRDLQKLRGHHHPGNRARRAISWQPRVQLRQKKEKQEVAEHPSQYKKGPASPMIVQGRIKRHRAAPWQQTEAELGFMEPEAQSRALAGSDTPHRKAGKFCADKMSGFVKNNAGPTSQKKESKKRRRPGNGETNGQHWRPRTACNLRKCHAAVL